MKMPAAVKRVGGSEGQSESKFAVSESALLRSAASIWVTSSWESWGQWKPSESQLAVTESASAGACGPYQTSGWVTLA